MVERVRVVGGGLAGPEAAWQLAQRGHRVLLYEMRPVVRTPAHQSDRLGELVCSNSFKSTEVTNAHGLLKAELRALGALLLRLGEETAVPGGKALAVDRDLFADRVTGLIVSHPNIEVIREEVMDLSPGPPTIVATGPLTSDRLSAALTELIGDRNLAFYDAISPIVAAESIGWDATFRGGRYRPEEPDYVNAPMTEKEYREFVSLLRASDPYPLHEFEVDLFFEGCLPLEEMARRGEETLRHGPLRPVGLVDPGTGKTPYAVIQMRQENRLGTMYGLVGCQTRLRRGDQRRTFGLVPALRDAEFFRYGSIHRNSYVNSPLVLDHALRVRNVDPLLFLAGQITGVEGYIESQATGFLAAINLDRLLRGEEPLVPPAETMVGGLVRHIVDSPADDFQPMNANFGLVPPLGRVVGPKAARREALAHRALQALEGWMAVHGLSPVAPVPSRI